MVGIRVDFANDDDGSDPDRDPYQQNMSPDDTQSLGDDSFAPDSFDVPDEIVGDEGGTNTSTPEYNLDKKIDPAKLVEKEIKKLQAANKRELKRQQADAALEARRKRQDEDRLLRQQQRAAKSSSQEQIANIRAQAVSTRIQSYTIASVLGLPGYAAASAYDQLGIRPGEKADISEHEAYQKRLDAYNAQEMERLLNERRVQDDNIRNTPIDAVDVNAVRQKYGLPPVQGTPPTNPPGPPGNNNPPGPPGNNPPGNNPPNNNPAAIPPILLPNQPTSPTQGGMSTGAVFSGVAIAFKTVQELNQAFDKVIKSHTDMITAKDPMEGFKAGIHGVRNSFDPLGVNMPAQIAVSGFDSLVDITKDIRDAAVKDLEFSPETLLATVDGSIDKLMQQIAMAQKLDPLKAEMVRANTQLDMAWNEFKGEMFVRLAPLVINLLQGLTVTLKSISSAGNHVGSSIKGFAAGLDPRLAILAGLLGAIAKNTDKTDLDKMDANGLMTDIQNFLDPKKAKAQFNNP